ncbi:MAG: hypothetical protein K9K86_03420 [Pseudomonadales bacterium]|nr:hypothetical protein [Pseudomonadales bacterium]
MKNRRILLGLVIIVMTYDVSAASDINTFSGWKGENWSLHGRLKQGVSVLYDLPDNDNVLGPSNTTAELKFSYRPNNSWTFITNAWYRADLSPSLGDDFDTGQGLQDPTSAGFNGRLPYRLNEHSCLGTIGDPFCADLDQIRRFDDLDEVLRELSIKYRDPKSRYTIKAGKFQRGWGQSDGLRLLDILHAQDLRERFAFRDSDELRIPAWMVSADLNFERMGIAAPFKALGMRRPTLEFNFVPEVHHSQFIINNPTPSSLTAGGAFGLPFPALKDPVSGYGLVGIGANLQEKTPDDFGFRDAEFSMRLRFDALGGEFTLNGFYGMQDLPLVEFTGANVVAGSALNNESLAAAVVPLDLANAIGAIHAPGGYLGWLRSVASGNPIPFPLSDGGIAPLAALSGGELPNCIDPVFGASTPADLPCSVNANFNLDYDHRQKVIGFSFARDMVELEIGRKLVTPTLRLEVAYELDKPFNRSVAADPFVPGATVSGSNSLVIGPSAAYTDSDVLSTMIGFDYALWVPGWDLQKKSIFTSFQFFNIHTFDADEGLLQQAPYGFETVAKNQQYATFLWNMPVINERLIFEGLFIRDFDNSGTFYRQRIDFQFFGNNFRPRLEWMTFSGEGQNAPIGILDHSDLIEFSLTYQF